MEDFSTMIYILFIILSIVAGLMGKNKKSPSAPKTSKIPRTQKSSQSEEPSKEKSFQEMRDEMRKRDFPQQQPEYTEEAVFEEPTYEFGNYEQNIESLEEIIQDEDDHRNTKIQWLMAEEEKSDDVWFNVNNWQQAIVVSEVLGKPKALQ